MRAIAGLLLVALSCACGYRPLYALHAGESFSVVVVSSSVTDAVATDEVASGVREELLRARAFTSGEGYPRAEIEVLRLDEASESLGIAPSGSAPEARSLRLGVVARAWIVRTKDGPRERDTGDVRALDVTAVLPDAPAAMFAAHDTLRASARRVGHRLGARLLGLPSASD